MPQRKSQIRPAAVKGMFYPGSMQEVRMIIEKALGGETENIDAHDFSGRIPGGVVPHAGMVFCARQAVHFFEHCRRAGLTPDTVVIIHPNHQGVGPAISTDGHDAWEAPVGEVPVDSELADRMNLDVSVQAQEAEHSAEVMLPYLQYFFQHPFKILSVNMQAQDASHAEGLAEKLHDAEKKLGRDVLVVASSDFSHFLTPDRSKELDDKVLEVILKKDADRVEEVVKQHHVSVCGFGPVMALMKYAALRYPDYKVHLLRRGHSGEVRPSKEVVNYVSLLFESA